MMPCANSQQTNAGVLCPARLSSTSSIRSGGSSASSVGLIVRPSCHRSQAARHPVGRGSPGGSGIAARIAASSRFSQGCRTALGQAVTPSRRTWPSAGWNSVRTLAVPSRRYSCGCRAGSPSGRQDWPGIGDRLERPGLVGAPDRQAHRLARAGRRPRSTFFWLGVRVGDDRRARPCGGAGPCRSGTRCGCAGSCSRPRGGPARWCRSRPAGRPSGAERSAFRRVRQRPGRGAVGLRGRGPLDLAEDPLARPPGRRRAAGRRRGGASGRPGPRR